MFNISVLDKIVEMPTNDFDLMKRIQKKYNLQTYSVYTYTCYESVHIIKTHGEYVVGGRSTATTQDMTRKFYETVKENKILTFKKKNW